MANIIVKAANNDRKAMEGLWNSTKQKVYSLSLLLLGNENDAIEITVNTYGDIWHQLKTIENEDAFEQFVLELVTENCKRKVNSKNNKAFRLPNNRKFILESVDSIENDTNLTDEVLNALPTLQRFIFVLNAVGGFSNEQIAAVFKLDQKTVGIALDALQINIKNTGADYSAVVAGLNNAMKEAKVSSELDQRVCDKIAEITAPARKKKIIVISITAAIVALAVALAAWMTAAFILNGKNNTSTTSSGTSNTSSAIDPSVITKPVIELDDEATYYADIDIKNHGTITVELDQSMAPVTVSNFINLSNKGFYDGLTFHRIIEGFMMQGGDPEGNGTGGAENDIIGEFSENGHNNTISHKRGVISMARATDPNSASSQFFIVHEDNPESLDGKYAAFGHVTKGMDIVDTICESAKPTDGNGTISAADQPIINSIKIRTEK